jgi:hypothetical protein
MWLIERLKSFLKRKESRDESADFQLDSGSLPLLAVIVTSSCTKANLETAIEKLLDGSSTPAQLVMYGWDEDNLIEELEQRCFSAIAIVDTILDQDESCEVLNAIQSSSKISGISKGNITIWKVPAVKKAESPKVESEEQLYLLDASKCN